MNLIDYPKKAITFAQKNIVNNIEYLALGLCGEAGEVAEKLKKVIRDGDGDLSAEQKLEIAKELGDVMWYVAMIANLEHIDLSSLVETSPDSFSLNKSAINIAVNASSIADFMMSGYYNNRPASDYRGFFFAVEDLINEVNLCCNCIRYHFEDILEINIRKLTSRKERNKLSGSGDNR